MFNMWSLVQTPAPNAPALTGKTATVYLDAVIGCAIRDLMMNLYALSRVGGVSVRAARFADLKPADIEKIKTSVGAAVHQKIVVASGNNRNLASGVSAAGKAFSIGTVQDRVGAALVARRTEDAATLRQIEASRPDVPSSVSRLGTAIAYAVQFDLTKGAPVEDTTVFVPRKQDDVAVFIKHAVVPPGYVARTDVAELCPELAERMEVGDLPLVKADYLEAEILKSACQSLIRGAEATAATFEDTEPAMLESLLDHPKASEYNLTSVYTQVHTLHKATCGDLEKADKGWSMDTYQKELEDLRVALALEAGTCGRDIIKAFGRKDMSKLVRVMITDRRGRRTPVWKKRGELSEEKEPPQPKGGGILSALVSSLSKHLGKPAAPLLSRVFPKFNWDAHKSPQEAAQAALHAMAAKYLRKKDKPEKSAEPKERAPKEPEETKAGDDGEEAPKAEPQEPKQKTVRERVSKADMMALVKALGALAGDSKVAGAILEKLGGAEDKPGKPMVPEEPAKSTEKSPDDQIKELQKQRKEHMRYAHDKTSPQIKSRKWQQRKKELDDKLDALGKQKADAEHAAAVSQGGMTAELSKRGVRLKPQPNVKGDVHMVHGDSKSAGRYTMGSVKKKGDKWQAMMHHGKHEKATHATKEEAAAWLHGKEARRGVAAGDPIASAKKRASEKAATPEPSKVATGSQARYAAWKQKQADKAAEAPKRASEKALHPYNELTQALKRGSSVVMNVHGRGKFEIRMLNNGAIEQSEVGKPGISRFNSKEEFLARTTEKGKAFSVESVKHDIINDKRAMKSPVGDEHVGHFDQQAHQYMREQFPDHPGLAREFTQHALKAGLKYHAAEDDKSGEPRKAPHQRFEHWRSSGERFISAMDAAAKAGVTNVQGKQVFDWSVSGKPLKDFGVTAAVPHVKAQPAGTEHPEFMAAHKKYLDASVKSDFVAMKKHARKLEEHDPSRTDFSRYARIAEGQPKTKAALADTLAAMKRAGVDHAKVPALKAEASKILEENAQGAGANRMGLSAKDVKKRMAEAVGDAQDSSPADPNDAKGHRVHAAQNRALLAASKHLRPTDRAHHDKLESRAIGQEARAEELEAGAKRVAEAAKKPAPTEAEKIKTTIDKNKRKAELSDARRTARRALRRAESIEDFNTAAKKSGAKVISHSKKDTSIGHGTKSWEMTHTARVELPDGTIQDFHRRESGGPQGNFKGSYSEGKLVQQSDIEKDEERKRAGKLESKWSKGKVHTSSPDGFEEKDAHRHGAWAVHGSSKDGYSVTHAPTGLRAFSTNTLAEAKGSIEHMAKEHPEAHMADTHEKVMEHIKKVGKVNEMAQAGKFKPAPKPKGEKADVTAKDKKAGWTKGQVNTAQRGEKEGEKNMVPVDAHRLGGWGVHKRVGESGGYTITHHDSGMSAGHTDTLGEAKALLKQAEKESPGMLNASIKDLEHPKSKHGAVLRDLHSRQRESGEFSTPAKRKAIAEGKRQESERVQNEKKKIADKLDSARKAHKDMTPHRVGSVESATLNTLRGEAVDSYAAYEGKKQHTTHLAAASRADNNVAALHKDEAKALRDHAENMRKHGEADDKLKALKMDKQADALTAEARKLDHHAKMSRSYENALVEGAHAPTTNKASIGDFRTYMKDSHDRAEKASKDFSRKMEYIKAPSGAAQRTANAQARSVFSELKEHALNTVKHSVSVMNHPDGGKPADPEARKLQESARKMLANAYDKYGKHLV